MLLAEFRHHAWIIAAGDAGLDTKTPKFAIGTERSVPIARNLKVSYLSDPFATPSRLLR